MESERKIDSFLLNEDEYLQDFYYFMSASKELTTCREYLRYVKKFIEFLRSRKKKGFDYLQISPADINRYIVHIRRKADGNETSDSYRATVWTAIRLFFQSMIISGHIDKNPCDSLERPKIRDEPMKKALNQEEITKLLESLKTGCGSRRAKEQQEKWKARDLLIIMLFLQTGMRVSALDEINVQDMNLKNCTVKVVEKGKKTTVKYFSSSLVPLIEAWLTKRKSLLGDVECDALFISNRRKRMCVQSINAMIEKYSDILGKRVTPHDFRRVYATSVYAETGDLYFVQECLGHENPKTTERYITPDTKQKRTAANIMSRFVVR